VYSATAGCPLADVLTTDARPNSRIRAARKVPMTPLLGELLAQAMLSGELRSERIDAKNVAIGRDCRLQGRGVRRRTDHLLCSYQPGMDLIGRR
jgi:hypothetical protein